MSPQVRSTATRLALGALIGAVSALDMVTPLGLNVPILYLVPLLIAFLTERVRTRVALTIVISLLTTGGAAWAGKWNEIWLVGTVNRAFDLGVFWVALALSIRDARTTRELRDLRTALDTASIVSIADATGIIRHVNDRFCEISKYSRDELIGREYRMVTINDSHASEVMHDLSASVAAGRIWHGEVHNRAKDGTLYWVDTTVVPFLDGKGAPYKYLAIHHDISAQKRAEARLRSEAAFAKIAEMAAIVAHEVRNPLAGVRGGLQLLETRRSLSPAEQLMMRQMQDRLDLLDAHVTALLQYTRPRSAQMQPIAVRALLEDVARTALASAAYSGVRCEISGTDAAVSGDGQMLREIFTNLLTNAADAQSRTGTIIVTVDESGDGVNVSTTDTGAGISPPLRERIFEPFFTTKPESAGLGLAIVAQLVELQGGEVAIAASSASGTTLRVKLPRAESAPAAGPAASGQLVPLPAF